MIKEVVLIIGLPASGKTTIAKDYVFREYARLNRDLAGGSVRDLLKPLKEFILSSEDLPGVVMDNTYGKPESRMAVTKLCKEYNVPVKCIWLKTSTEDSLYNAALRMLDKHNKLLGPDDIKNCKDPNLFPPGVVYHYAKNFNAPTKEEGFADILEQPFVRKFTGSSTQKALLLDFDGTLRDTKSGRNYPKDIEDIVIRPRVKEVLSKYVKDGYLLLGASNQSGIAKGELSNKQADLCFKKTLDLLEVNIDYIYCGHPSGPPSCYCRKPMSGIAIHFMKKYNLLPQNMIMVGDLTTDHTFAKRCNIPYISEKEFFN